MFSSTQRPTNNPYFFGGFVIWERLKWDLQLESWRSRKKIKDLKDKFIGKKAVIVCNGPSLLKSDLGLLNGIYTFGLNKINLLFDKSDFRPSCIVSINKLVIEQNREFFNKTDIDLFLDQFALSYVRPEKNRIFVHSSQQKKFSQDCSMSVYQGNTVTYVAMQLAFHMGFSKVALIGCDHNFSSSGQPNKIVESESVDASHFDPNYFSGGVKWQLPDLLQSEVAYNMAKYAFEENGKKIINATEGGMLEVFPRISLEEFVSAMD